MKLKDLILMSDGYDLPISGGTGNSMDNFWGCSNEIR